MDTRGQDGKCKKNDCTKHLTFISCSGSTASPPAWPPGEGLGLLYFFSSHGEPSLACVFNGPSLRFGIFSPVPLGRVLSFA